MSWKINVQQLWFTYLHVCDPVGQNEQCCTSCITSSSIVDNEWQCIDKFLWQCSRVLYLSLWLFYPCRSLSRIRWRNNELYNFRDDRKPIALRQLNDHQLPRSSKCRATPSSKNRRDSLILSFSSRYLHPHHQLRQHRPISVTSWRRQRAALGWKIGRSIN